MKNEITLLFSPDALLAGLWPGGGGVHSVLPALGGGAPPLPRLRQHLRPGGGQDQRLHLCGKDDISSQVKLLSEKYYSKASSFIHEPNSE